MKNSLLAVTASIAWLCAFSPPPAAAENPTDAFLYDTEDSVTRNSYGECWQTSSFTPDKLTPECGGQVAEAPPPPPEPIYEKFTLEADTLFDFDKATLRPEGREKIDDIVTKIKQEPGIQQVRIAAYADPIGTDSYNADLSQRRAGSVRDYMIDQGIEPQRIDATGKGETNEFAPCEDVRGRSNLIRCYQPNRRAEIEIIGQRTAGRTDQTTQ
jgi:OOP family OmpA-OmpF porin